MLDTIEFAIKAVMDIVMVLALLMLSTALIRGRGKDRPECEDWTSADRGVASTCRALMWSVASLAWALVIATVVHDPGLIREPALINIVFIPLLLAFMAAIWSTPKALANLHRTRNFRALMFSATAVIVLGLAASLLVLFNTWTARI